MPGFGKAGAGAPPRSPAVVALLALLLGTFVLGVLHVGAARPLFVLGAVGVSYLAWREGPARSVETTIFLFAFAPFLRRVVDYALGYEETGTMLVGPVLAVLLPSTDLRYLLMRRWSGEAFLAPMVLAGLCLIYATVVSLLSGMVLPSLIALLKFSAPLLYGAWIMFRARQDDTIVAVAARAFMLAAPIMGAYAVLQYADPPNWDRYWMLYTKMDSIGRPEPFQVRVFSTMNSPASYATFTACGLLLFGFCRRGWQSALLALPAAIGLLLTLYRTAWISLTVGILYCALFPRTRGRAGLIAAFIVLAALIASSTTEFGDVITERISTLSGSVSEDGSGRARLGQYQELYEQLDDAVLGSGLAGTQTATRAVDGEIFAALLTMGLVVGPIYLFALVWAGLQALRCIRPQDGPTRLVIGAGIAGTLSQLPLASITSAELGLLFWMLVGLATGSAAGRASPLVEAARTAASEPDKAFILGR